MKILFLSTVFPNGRNASRGCFNDSLVRALAIGNRVEVISPIPWIDLVKGYRLGIRVPLYRRIADPAGFGIHYLPFIYTPRILRHWYGDFYWSSIAGTVRSLIRTHCPELIIGYWAHPDGEAAVRIGRLVGAPSCVIIGGSDVLLMTRKPSRRRRIQNVLEATDAVITVNDDLRNVVVKLGVRADKVHIWRQGIDIARFQPGDRRLARQQLGIPVRGRMIVWVGRMDPVKGLDVLVESCALLRARGVEYHLFLVGDGPLRRDRAADLTVLPSRSEGLPNVLRESLACGTPFVASDVGGIDEIADPSWCLLVRPEDPASLADAIAQALARWDGLGTPIAPRFQSWEDSATALVGIMQSHVTARAFERYKELNRSASLY
jgi:teichuronic acid biosynthesis glycosyltransferase TuaC